MAFETAVKGQKWLAPEVVQTSAMDCGPAALKSLLEGFGVSVSYGRLREACQTNVDGTSINTLEDVAVQLGLEAEQVMLPVDHLVLAEAQALPALVTVRQPNGMTHFLVVWGRVGEWLQVMDPATGRRWVRWERFRNDVYLHTFPVSAAAWRAWAGSEGMLRPLRRRMQALKMDEASGARLVAEALADESWRSLGALDAAVRMVAAVTAAGGVKAGPGAGALVGRYFEAGRAEEGERLSIPAVYWSVQPYDAGRLGLAAPQSGEELLLLRGAVLIRVLGRRSGEVELLEEAGRAQLPAELAAALTEPVYRPERAVWDYLKEDGLLTPMVLVVALALASIGVLFEGLLFQGIMQIGASLGLVSQRVGAMVVLLGFVLALLALEMPIAAVLSGLGRHLEVRLRVALLEKIPRLSDRYFHSRLTSDMTQRAHDLRSLRGLPGLGVGLVRTAMQLVLTTLGVIWLDPISAPLALTATGLFIAYSSLTRPLLEERDLKLRTHLGGLSRFYLDGLLGLAPLKTHGAERALRRQHESQLVEWVRAGREYYNAAAYLQALGSLLYSLFAVVIVLNYIRQGGVANEILLLFYWTLNLPALGQSLASQIQMYPMQRNRVLRLLEPLSAPDEDSSPPGSEPPPAPREAAPGGVAIEMAGVGVQASGHIILEDVQLTIGAGEHVGIVGPSGAGKSSLVGLLLGWHQASAGEVRVDGRLLAGGGLAALRRQTAWVDPAVQLWNRSLYENLKYGSRGVQALGEAIQCADLYGVLEKLPEGLKTPLGEGGGLVSGGEGQRVRLGRALLRSGVRLAILDEPFRGLDRERRRKLLQEARQHWTGATLLCVTHDVSETLSFPRVLVVEGGRIVEDGDPQALAEQPGSRYRALLEAEEQVRRGLWQGAGWRRLWLEEGRLK